MSISARLKRQGENILGVLVPVPERVMMEGGERDGASLVFSSMTRFKEVVADLKNRYILSDYPPYVDLLNDQAPAIIPFNWSRVPQSTMNSIMEHQKQAVDLIVTQFKGRALISLRPGLGKTLIGCLCTLHYGSSYMVVCPASKITDWRNEMAQWTGNTMPPMLTKKTANAQNLVCSFDTLKRMPEVVDRKFSLVIVDECHKIKGDSERTRELTKTLLKADARVLLSGTPQENRPSELFNLLHVLHPSIFTSRVVYTERYCDGQISARGVWEERGAKNLEELSIIMDRCMYRRDDVVVVDVELKRIKVNVDCIESQAEQLLALKQKQTDLRMEETNARDATTKRRIGMKRNQHANLMWETAGKFKLDAAFEWLEETLQKHKDEKVAIFVYHHEVAATLKERLPGDVQIISGKTSIKKRDAFFAEFRKKDEGPRVGILTMDAVGDGINLAPGVSVIICFELSRQPSKMEQMEKRAYRKGAVSDVTSYWCVLGGSNDEQTLTKLQFKANINSRVLNGNKKAKIMFDDDL